MEQEKQITITNLTSKNLTPKPGATWKPFTVYSIQGNDGIYYETVDGNYFKGLTIGQSIKIHFRTETKTSNGKVYTSYKLVLPKKMDPAVGEMKAEILAKIDLAEKNIIAAIKLLVSKPSTPKVEDENPNQLSLFPDEVADDIDPSEFYD